jgi:hypothetical protein
MNELPGDNVGLSELQDACIAYNYGICPIKQNSYEIWQQCNRV